MATRYGYILVNELWEMSSNTGLDAQRYALNKAGVKEIVKEFHDGTQDARIKLSALINSDRLVDGDTLIVQRLGVLSNSGLEAAELVRHLVDRGVSVEIMNMGRADSSKDGERFIDVLLAVAEFANESYVEYSQVKRTNAFEQSEKRKAYGRVAHYTKEQYDDAMHLILEQKLSYDEVAKRTKISKRQLHRERARREVNAAAVLHPGNARKASRLAKLLGTQSLREDKAEWFSFCEQLKTLYRDVDTTEAIAVFYAIGLSTPPFDCTQIEWETYYRILLELGRLYQNNKEINKARLANFAMGNARGFA